MKNTLLFCLSLVLFWSCSPSEKTDETTTSTAEQAPPTSAAEIDKSIELPDGFTATVFAEDLGRARHIAVRDNGDVYIQLRDLKEGKGLVALRDSDKDGKADDIQYFGSHTGTGMDIYNGYIYCSSMIQVFRYPLPTDGSLVPNEDDRVLIVGGFIDQQSHADKPFTFDNDGNIYVNVGAPSNACMQEARTKGSPGLDPCPQLERQAGIWRFDANKIAQNQQEDGYRYAMGIRNTIALDWNDADNRLYILQHGRDQLNQFFPDMFTEAESAELPSEEFLKLEDGSNAGWPYCYYDQTENKKLLNPEYGGDRKKQERCADMTQPILGFPGHLAPNDLLFYTGNQFPEKYKNGAFIAFHGSWNRSPQNQEGYYVVFVPMKDGAIAGDWEIFADGFSGGAVKSPREAVHRPCGLAQGADGALYITDSVKGKVWKIGYKS